MLGEPPERGPASPPQLAERHDVKALDDGRGTDGDDLPVLRVGRPGSDEVAGSRPETSAPNGRTPSGDSTGARQAVVGVVINTLCDMSDGPFL